MNQREEILRAWNRYSATAYHSPQFDKAQAFFQLVSDRQNACWDELEVEFRRNYYDAFDEIVGVLMSTNDPLIIYNCVRLADASNPKEANALKNFIRQADPQKHEVSLAALAAVPAMQTELLNKQQLPASVRTVLGEKGASPT